MVCQEQRLCVLKLLFLHDKSSITRDMKIKRLEILLIIMLFRYIRTELTTSCGEGVSNLREVGGTGNQNEREWVCISGNHKERDGERNYFLPRLPAACMHLLLPRTETRKKANLSSLHHTIFESKRVNTLTLFAPLLFVPGASRCLVRFCAAPL